jgi:hypothetical protein
MSPCTPNAIIAYNKKDLLNEQLQKALKPFDENIKMKYPF